MDFSCPVCGETLVRAEKTYRCRNRHSFDIAKQGYVNLLMNNSSSDKRHGDDRLMVASRRDFLETGHYDRLCSAVCRAVCDNARDGTNIIDAGCGEGYYTRRIAEALSAQGKRWSIAGVDISRDALIAASKRNRELMLAVGSIFRLPFANGSADILVNIFAPHDAAEFARVLGSGGILIRVIPLENHLLELKEAVYDRVYANTVASPELEGFALSSSETLKYTAELNSQKEISDLFSMTPYYYKTSQEGQERLKSLNKLTTTLEFCILVYKKL